MFIHILNLEIRAFIQKLLKEYISTSYIINNFIHNLITYMNKVYFLLNCYYSLIEISKIINELD